MKNNMTFRLFGWVLNRFSRDSGVEKETCREIMNEYRRILRRAKEVSADSPLLSSYSMGAYFIAMNRFGRTTPEENYQILSDGLSKSPLVRMFLGNADSYLSDKRLPGRQAWSKCSHEHPAENDWVVDVLPRTAEYDLGYDYLECGVCKLCRDEECPELAKYLCRLDYLLTERIGVHLTRTKTLAEGGDRCDFRFHR